MLKEKILSLQSKIKIFQEVNFYQVLHLSGDQTSTTSTNRTNQNGLSLADSNTDTESKKIS